LKTLPTLTHTVSPTQTLEPTLDFQAYDLRWCISDTEGDVEITYIDVVRIDAIWRGETFIARVFVKSIPEFLTFNREGVPTDHLEYSWEILIDVDGDAKANSLEFEDFSEYDLAIVHFVFPEDETKDASLSEGTQQNVWKTDSTQPTWENIGEAEVEINYLAGTITITGDIPGLNSNSKIGFSTFDYNPDHEEQEDKLDSPNMVPPNRACT